MKNRSSLVASLISAAAFAGLSGLLISCGQPVCVAGIGKCDVPVSVQNPPVTQGGPSPSTNPVKLSGSPASILVNQSAIFSVTGGIPPYRFDLVGDGTTTATSAFGSLTPSGSFSSDTQTSYKAPTTVPATGLSVRVMVTDSSSPAKATDVASVLVKAQ